MPILVARLAEFNHTPALPSRTGVPPMFAARTVAGGARGGTEAQREIKKRKRLKKQNETILFNLLYFFKVRNPWRILNMGG